MNHWDDLVREEHRTLRALAEDLEVVLTLPGDQREQQQAAISWISQTLDSALETHLEGEEQVLFPAMAKLLGDDANALRLLRDQHQGLREAVHDWMAAIQSPETVRKNLIRPGMLLTHLLDDHEQKIQRLLIDILEFSLARRELDELAKMFATHQLHADRDMLVA